MPALCARTAACSASASPEELGGRIVAAVSEDVGGLIALNANTALVMVNALHAAGVDTQRLTLAAVSSEYPRLPAMLHSGRLSFIVWSQAGPQGFYAPALIPYIRANPLSVSTGFFSEAEQVLIQPAVVRRANVVAFLEAERVNRELPEMTGALERAIAAEAAVAGAEGDSP